MYIYREISIAIAMRYRGERENAKKNPYRDGRHFATPEYEKNDAVCVFFVCHIAALIYSQTKCY